MNIIDTIIESAKKRKSLKKNKGSANQSTPESNAANALGSVTRSATKRASGQITALRCSEAMRVLSKTDAAKNGQGVQEGPRVRVVLISEGLGNRKDMNYYGPEAIDSAPSIFEGKPCFVNHQGEFETRDRPEGDVRNKCGYFKNCRVEAVGGIKSCTGELHFDLAESGRDAYAKACTALHYRSEFPNLESEYVGLSINASGDYEDRKVSWQGELLDVNYVTRFTGATSCDIVTTPARGGKFLALVESAAGAIQKAKPPISATPSKEESMENKLNELLEAAVTAIKESDAEKTDLELKNIKTAEAMKALDAFLTEAKKNSDGEESEDGEESKCEDEAKPVKQAKKSKQAKKKEKKDEEADDSGDDDNDDDSKESQRVAVVALAKEAGLKLKDHQIEKLVLMPFQEAKAEIRSYKDLKESILSDVNEAMGKVPGVHMTKTSESSRTEVVTSNDDLFANLAR